MNKRLDTPEEREEAAIMPRPVPGAELCEQTETFAGYWKKGAWSEPNRESALVCMEQAVNGWKNLAYDLARQLHYAQRSAPSERKLTCADCGQELGLICPGCSTDKFENQGR